MPTRGELQSELTAMRTGGPDKVRRRHLKALAKYTDRDVVLYASGFNSLKVPGLPGFALSVNQADIQGFMAALHGLKRKNLDLILHSPGGSLEAADQIVQYLRGKFDHIRAIVPQNAMSAATAIACACDEIVMGKHSAIGPIDPQVTFPTQTGHFTAPAHAILAEFDQARSDMLADPRTAPLWVNKINTYPAGFLNICRDTIALAQDKVAGWLTQYMFQGDPQAAQKGKKVGQWLADATNHKAHGRPITISQAQSVGLKVVALESDQELQEKVLSVFHATMLTLEQSTCAKLVENHNGKGWFLMVNVDRTNQPT